MLARVDYLESGRRHFDDGLRLAAACRLPNAGQLFGLSAECGVKGLLVALGHQTESDGGLGKGPLRKHVNQLHAASADLSVFLTGRNAGRYWAMLPSLANFVDWSVDQRYYGTAGIPQSHANWQAAAREVQEMLQQAQLDGVVA